jgi:ribonuclease BN (tRNA processing enzyme)
VGDRTPGIILTLITIFGLIPAASAAADSPCPPATGVGVQVLGSGGPVADDERASSGYLVWLDGAARVLVDAGAGTALRFGEAGARFEDLDLIALSHFHTDHSADLSALLKTGYFSDRERPLVVSGPDGRGAFPSLDRWLEAQLGPEGAWAYLGGYLDGTDGLVRLEPVTLSHVAESPAELPASDRVTVKALGVPHGIVPALAYRVEVDGRTIVFASDQNGSDERFTRFAQQADLLIAHLAIPESAGGAAVRLHTRPSTIGEVAARAGVKRLLLSHFMARSLRDLDRQVAEVESRFHGPVDLAQDLSCFVP